MIPGHCHQLQAAYPGGVQGAGTCINILDMHSEPGFIGWQESLGQRTGPEQAQWHPVRHWQSAFCHSQGKQCGNTSILKPLQHLCSENAAAR